MEPYAACIVVLIFVAVGAAIVFFRLRNMEQAEAEKARLAGKPLDRD
jgi:hypothetical protein